MKKIVLIAGALALAGCENQADAPAEEAAVEEAAAVYPGGAGTYQRTNDEGALVQTVIAADGSFTSTLDGEETGSGTVTVDGATICFTSAEEGEEESCWQNQPLGEDGSFDTTSPDGVTYTVQMTAAAE